MLEKHLYQPAALAALQDQLPDTDITPVRHGRLFQLLRHDTTVGPTEDDMTLAPKRKDVVLSDDDMYAIQAAAMQSLLPRAI